MPATKTPRKPTTKRTPSTHARSDRFRSGVERTTVMSDEVLKSVEHGQRAAIAAVQKFVDTVDEKLPPSGTTPSRRQEIVDAALEMADSLVQAQYKFLRDVVKDAGGALKK